MRAPLVILIGLFAIASAHAETLPRTAPVASPSTTKILPLKGTSGSNPCSAYGPGFVRVESTGSCVKVGGSIDVGVGTSIRR
ncbi:hypothetical protein JQ596_23270 [Bradyrhizobium manausense]|uniref:hypothetical protein n=1 Tax=Bradyrhizobium TaxID=374 RepID=UPI001BAA4F66|nr:MULTISPECIES: hypothetical protein [Bradyrhizobium]MBR0828462.1 hypothetical protein [Bradyrhizobium manausense]UVO25477.1 hypothetical protein KUF59_23035 [Bradyrhizobium arachidis]